MVKIYVCVQNLNKISCYSFQRYNSRITCHLVWGTKTGIFSPKKEFGIK